MKVAMDATPLTLSSGGIARYTAELAAAMAENFPEDEVVLVSDQPFQMPAFTAHNLRMGGSPRNALERRWWLWGVQREIFRQGAEVFHGAHFVVPWLALRPAVATFHDLSPWRAEHWREEAAFVRRRASLGVRLGAATMFITPSDAVRREVIGRFGINPGRVVATPLAASRLFRPVTSPPPARPYFLFVGTLEPRKNLAMLVDAWREVRKEWPVDLVLAGRRGKDAPVFGREAGLHLPGEVPDADLPALYSGALAFVYPSLYEGFGLPVLEAMQCGAAVIASGVPAIREVTDGAAQLLDPLDGKAWVEAMRASAAQPGGLAFWRERSLQRAAAFSWAGTARLTRQVYEEAVRRFGR